MDQALWRFSAVLRRYALMGSIEWGRGISRKGKLGLILPVGSGWVGWSAERGTCPNTSRSLINVVDPRIRPHALTGLSCQLLGLRSADKMGKWADSCYWQGTTARESMVSYPFGTTSYGRGRSRCVPTRGSGEISWKRDYEGCEGMGCESYSSNCTDWLTDWWWSR